MTSSPLKLTRGHVVRAQFSSQPIAFFVSNGDDHIQAYHYAGLFYEQEELAIIARAFIPGGCFVDIGANVGNHTLYVAKYLAPSKVICFEPNPEAYELLDINVRLNELGALVDRQFVGIGLSSKKGAGFLFQPQIDNLGAMRLIEAEDEVGSVPLDTGDHLLKDESPTFVKIDVEGHEIDVLHGLKQVIARCRPTIFVEVDNQNRASFDTWCERFGYDVAESFRRYPQNENFLLIARDRA